MDKNAKNCYDLLHLDTAAVEEGRILLSSF